VRESFVLGPQDISEGNGGVELFELFGSFLILLKFPDGYGKNKGVWQWLRHSPERSDRQDYCCYICIGHEILRKISTASGKDFLIESAIEHCIFHYVSRKPTSGHV
jgi:hypothetical protein